MGVHAPKSGGFRNIPAFFARKEEKEKEKKDEEINIKMKTRLASYPYVTCL